MRRAVAWFAEHGITVERFNLTLKEEWAYAAAHDGNQARLDILARWLHHYRGSPGRTDALMAC